MCIEYKTFRLLFSLQYSCSMTQLSDFSLDQLTGAVALGLSSVGGLTLILFKSKCTSVTYSCCWGLFKYSCARVVTCHQRQRQAPPPCLAPSAPARHHTPTDGANSRCARVRPGVLRRPLCPGKSHSGVSFRTWS